MNQDLSLLRLEFLDLLQKIKADCSIPLDPNDPILLQMQKSAVVRRETALLLKNFGIHLSMNYVSDRSVNFTLKKTKKGPAVVRQDVQGTISFLGSSDLDCIRQALLAEVPKMGLDSEYRRAFRSDTDEELRLKGLLHFTRSFLNSIRPKNEVLAP